VRNKRKATKPRRKPGEFFGYLCAVFDPLAIAFLLLKFEDFKFSIEERKFSLFNKVRVYNRENILLNYKGLCFGFVKGSGFFKSKGYFFWDYL